MAKSRYTLNQVTDQSEAIKLEHNLRDSTQELTDLKVIDLFIVVLLHYI